MRDPKKPTETGGGEGDQTDRLGDRADRPGQVAAYFVIESGLAQLQQAGITRRNLRRILDVLISMTAPQPGPDATAEALDTYRGSLLRGILAGQSTDDFGPPLNERLWKDHEELQARLKAIDVRLEALLAKN